MRLRYAVGLTVVILAVAAGALVWAPAITAQQDTSGWQARRNLAVANDGWSEFPQVAAARAGQGGNVFTFNGNDFTFGGPRLGVSIRDVEAADVTKMKLAGQGGVVVEEVTAESAAAKAGLKAGDVLVQFDGEAVRSARQFTRLVSESAPGRAVKIGVMRDGRRTDVEATLPNSEAPLADVLINRDGMKREVERGLAEAERNKVQADRYRTQVEPLLRQFRMERQPGGNFTFEGPIGDMLANRGRLGVTVQELTPELAAYFGVKDGVLVSAVRADSPAAKAGIKAGDVITTINDKPVTDASALVDQMRDKEGDVTIGLSRDKKAMSLKATFEKAQPPSKSRIVVRRRPA